MNGIIYTKNYVLRDKDYNLLSEYKRIDIVTCAAVNIRHCDNNIS